MATPTKGQRPRFSKSRVVSAPEATRNHSPFPASTHFEGKNRFVINSSSPLHQADLSGHPYDSIASGSDSEPSTTGSCPSSPSTSSPLTPTSSLSPSPTRAGVTSCGGGTGGHQRSVSEGTISTRKRTEQSPLKSRAGRSRSHAPDLVRNKTHLGETLGDPGASDVEASLANTSQQLVFTNYFKRVISSPSNAHKVLTNMLKAAPKSNNQQKPEKANDWGCIYILQNPHYPEYVKIGRTEYDPEDRAQQWLRCGCELNIFEELSECFIRVPYHTKLEGLIFHMLRNERRKFACVRCTEQSEKNIPAGSKISKHGEWFQIDKDHAVRLVKTARAWMRSSPYDEHGELTADWKTRVTRIRNNIPAFAQNLDHEIKEGRRWEAFLTMPDATRLSRIQQWALDKRPEPNGRLCPSRFDAFCKHKQRLFVFCMLHYGGVTVVSGHFHPSLAPYMFLLATLSSAAFAL